LRPTTARWEKCGIPDSVTFRTKPELGAEMIAALVVEGMVPFRWIAMDEGYGAVGYLLDQIDGENELFFAEVPRDKQAWPHRPKVVPPPEPGPMGRPPTRTHLAADAPPAQRVDELAQQLRPADWQRFIIHEGTKGPQEVETLAPDASAGVAVQRVVPRAPARSAGVADEEMPGRTEWLVLRRAIGASLANWKFYRSNAPTDMPRTTLARMTAWRWPVETVIEVCKGELGLDYYEVRGWIGWHHHTTMTLLAHHFLVRLRVNRGIAAPALTVAQVRKLLQVVLPKCEFNAQEALAELARIQNQNHAAYRSHRKRRWQERKSLPPN
jgi:hypothetical protein